jgi:hypothetical protein
MTIRNIQFEEKQRFTSWWLWTLLIGITLIPVYGIFQQIIMGTPFGDNPMPDYGLLLFLLFMLLFMGFFRILQLTTTITDESIQIVFFPFVRKEFKWEEIENLQLVNYGFVGGWGIRSGTKYGTVYNTSGKTGLAIQLKNGEKLCVGTQKEAELEVILKNMSRSNQRKNST